MNETLKILETRRSCRNFKPDMVKKEDLDATESGRPLYKKCGFEDSGECMVLVREK